MKEGACGKNSEENLIVVLVLVSIVGLSKIIFQKVSELFVIIAICHWVVMVTAHTRRRKTMKIEILKNGSIQGWFVSFLITIITLMAFIASMIFDQVAARFEKIGVAWATIVIGQFGAWLAYRAYSGKPGNGGTPPTQ